MTTMGLHGADRSEDALLRDGTTVRIRPARGEDLVGVEDYLLGLSDQTRMLRFGSQTLDVGATGASIVAGTTDEHRTLLAFQGGEEGSVVGGTQYFRLDAGRAEVSVSVADGLQGKGLGSILIGRIAQLASAAGIGTLVAYVRPENHRMISVFRESGFDPFDPCDARDDRRRVPHIPHERRGGGVRAASGRGRTQRGEGVPPTFLGRGDRRVARSGVDREPALPEPDHDRLHGRRISREPARGLDPWGAELRIDLGYPRPRRRRVRVRTGGSRSGGASRLR